MTFTSILCPVDFSDHSRAALRYALATARRFDAPVTTLFVNDPLLVAAAATAFTPLLLEQTSLRELRDFVDRTVKTAGGRQPRVSCEVAQGDPAAAIDQAIRRHRANLVVVGTHGLGGARKLVFGSTTARALQRAKVPVLAVPPAAIEKAPSPSWPGRRILAAVDFNAQTAADLRSAAQVAHAFDARLVVVHVLKPVSAPRWLTATIVGQDRARLDEARTALERLVRPLKPTAATECRVLVGEPGEELPSVAAAAKTGLILVTLRKEQGMLGAPQGSVTYDVLRHATVPVLALPGGRSASRR